jgi:EH_Signature domain
MPRLFEAIQSAQQIRPRKYALPEIPEMDKAYQQVKRTLGEERPPKLPQEPEYWVKMARDAFDNKSLHNLNHRELKNISLCLWYGNNPLEQEEYFLKPFLNVCETQVKKSLCRALIWVYLHNFEKGIPSISLLGNWLAKIVRRWDWPWADRHLELSLFNGHEAANSIAKSILDSNENVKSLLESIGIKGSLQSGDMVSAALVSALEQYQKNSTFYTSDKVDSWLKRLFEWAMLGGQNFSYPKLKKLFIESLLLPWANKRPEETIVNQTQSFLLDSFGDPRLGGASWIGVNENAMQVIRRWLVKRALAQFLDVVDELALDHQWKYRRAFWMAYYKKAVISDAWVAFATRGASKAKYIAQRTQDKTWLNFGKLYPYRDASHAVLILRIGDLTIVDFSHNGKWRIWNRGNENAPKPYEKRYDCDDLIIYGGANHEGSHHSSENYRWQREIENIITGSIGRNVISQMVYRT